VSQLESAGEPAARDLGRQAARGAFWVAASSWVNRLMLLVVLAVLAQRLGPREFGVLGVLGLARNALVILGGFGFADAIVYQRDRVRAAGATAFTITTVLGLLLGLAILPAAPLVAAFFHIPDATGPIRAYALVIAASTAGRIPLAMLTRDLAFGRRFLPEGVGSVAGGLVTVGTALAGAGVWSVVLGELVREVLVLALVVAILPDRFGFGWDGGLASTMWRYARHALTSELSEFALQNIDYALVGRLLGPMALGLYTLAFRVAILPFVAVTYVVGGVSFPFYARAAPDLGRVRDGFRSTFNLGMAVTTLFAGGLVFLAPSLQVLGAQWTPAIPVARALALYVCLRSAAHLMTPLLAATGHPGADAALRTCWFLLLTGTVVAATRVGITTVGIAQAVVAGVMLVAYTETARRLVGIRPGAVASTLARLAVAVALGGGCVLGLRMLGGVWTADATWPTLLLLGTAFALAFGAACWLLLPEVATQARRVLGHLTRGAPQPSPNTR
jgi:O-antigen/teichoic acid export membrane protein